MTASRISGRTDRIVVVGAGLAGLSCAMRLAGAGRTVTVLEREPVPGGRAGLIADGGYRFDTGPTVLTMPGLVRDAFAAVGEDSDRWLQLDPVDPIYRAHFPDGSTLDVHSDPQRMAAQIASVIGPAEAGGYLRFVDFASTMYRLQMNDFIDRNFDSPVDLLTMNLVRLAAAGGFRRMAPKVGQYLKDPRTRRVFSFQSMYAGLAPQQALALYSVIAYMDCVAGVFQPRGGVHALPTAMAAAAAAHGVDFAYGRTVARVERTGRRATAVITGDGERIPADVVVINADLPAAYRDLLGLRPLAVRRLRYSPSCFVLLAGSTRRYSRIGHHNLHFGRAWSSVFADLIDRRIVMSDPSLLVSSPTRSDSSLAPPGRHIYYVLLPTPNLDADIDWARFGPVYTERVLQTLESRGYRGFADSLEVMHVRTPADWAALGLERGTPFGPAHTFGQTGPFRPGNRWGDNVVFAGSATRPGVGVPMALLSGRLAAERVVGPVR